MSSALGKKSIPELIAEGREKLTTVPMGGAAAPGGVGAPAAAASAPAESKGKEAPKPEVKEESESEGDMGFGLFD